MEEDFKTLGDYLEILRRRWVQLVVPAAVLLFASVAVALALPAVYRSTATILIEQQDIPPELVRSTVSSYADERIQVISQRVMTSSNLSEIIKKYELYQKEQATQAMEEVLAGMRNDVNLAMVSADVIDPRSGRPTQATIAFTLSYDSGVPELAQRVANELVSLYLNENLRARARKAADASDFLTEEATKLRAHIGNLEQQLADFKEENVGQLPELTQLNLQLMERTERQLMELQHQVRAVEERMIYLESELAQIHPNVRILSTTGQPILGPRDRLKGLEAEYVSKSALYSASHPDVVKMRRELDALREETGDVSALEEIAKQLATLQAELSVARETYAPEHPDVKRLQRGVEALEQRLKDAPMSRVVPSSDLKPDNPAYIQLQAQLEAARAELDALRRQERGLRARLVKFEERLTQTPQVERQYRPQMRDYEDALTKYGEIKAKQWAAQLSEELEKDSKGERFSLIEPPLLPQKPVKPNRLAIMFLGLMLSVAGGLGTVIVSESADHGVRGARGVASVFGAPPLAVIPCITSDQELRKRARRRVIAVAGIVVAICIVLFGYHSYVRPLDVVWFVLLRKLGV